MGRILWTTAAIVTLGLLAACQTINFGGSNAATDTSAQAAVLPAAPTQPEPPAKLPDDPPPPPDTPEQTQAKEALSGQLASAVGKSGGTLKIVFVDATSKTLLSKKQIDFSPEVVLDLPVDATKGELETALADPSVDYIVVLDTALAKAERRVFGLEKQKSTTVVAVEKVPNPDYDILRMELADSQARARGGGGGQDLGAAIGAMIGAMMAGARAEEAKKKLRETPAFIDKPTYGEYTYDLAKVGVTKKMTVNYYVVDRATGNYFKSLFDVVDNRQFLIPYKLSDKDEDRVGILTKYTSDEQVGEWEERPVRVKLSQIAEHYLDNRASAKKLPAVAKLRDELLVDRSASIGNYQANKFGYTKGADPRLNSVVAVYIGEGSMGSGFFVEPDIVLTNWHVVENSKVIEMRQHNGPETFGKVIAKDVRLDLALIKVQTRGIPVRFYTDRNVELGWSVDAIGHPHRYLFSVTRGVISSVREGAPHTGVGGKRVLYIQTDTAINAGNSGGPLFKDDAVVGVNSWGDLSEVPGTRLKAKGSIGLNFAVHYSEVLSFLRENNVSYLTADASPRRSAGKGAKQ